MVDSNGNVRPGESTRGEESVALYKPPSYDSESLTRTSLLPNGAELSVRVKGYTSDGHFNSNGDVLIRSTAADGQKISTLEVGCGSASELRRMLASFGL